jgi:CheY-specific phosphatase CheX
MNLQWCGCLPDEVEIPAMRIDMPGPKQIEPSAILPRTTWHSVLSETAIEVFSTMVGVSVRVAPDDLVEVAGQVTGVIGIAGAMRANFILQCSTASSIQLASQMLGISADDPNSQKAACDALGEICNIVAGYFKAKVGLGDACMLSVPTVIVGRDYRFRSGRTYERLEVPLLYEGETLWITLEIAQ